MKKWLQVSNIGSYFYIVISLCISYVFFYMLVPDMAIWLLVVYVIVMIILGPVLTSSLLKIKFNLPKRDLQRVQPMLQMLVKRAYKKGHVLPTSYRVGYVNDPNVWNAYAFGKSNIALSRDLLDSLSDEQLIGVLAHELGHIYYGHAQLQSIVFASNVLLVMIIVLCEVLILVFGFLLQRVGKSFAIVITTLFGSIVTMIYLFIQGMTSVSSRENELKCDLFAHELGMKNELISALTVIQQLESQQKPSFISKVTASHPDTKMRIFKLKSL